MDTNQKQNNQQINTFTGGMNTDTSDMYLKSDLYRYAENLRITSDENGEAGELHLIEGTSKIDTDYEEPEVWTLKKDVSAQCPWCSATDDDHWYDIDQFYITLYDTVIFDTHYQKGDDVEIIVFEQEDGMSLYKDVSGTHVKLELPCEVTIKDFTEERLGWSYDGNELYKKYHHLSRELFLSSEFHISSSNMDAEDMSTFVYVLYINKTQKYYSRIMKFGQTKSEVRRLIYERELLWDNLPVQRADSNLVIVGQDPFYILTGTILDVNYIKNICTIIEVKEGRWRIDLYDYEQNRLFLIAGPFNEPIWKNTEDIGKKKILSTTLIWEADDNIKLYIADGIHELLSIKMQKDANGMYKQIEGSFDDIFLTTSMLLPPLNVLVGDRDGQIEHVKVQYAYILYKKYGKASALSSLSDWLSLYDTKTKGFAKGTTTNKSVAINIPQIRNSNTDNIRIYRISYEAAGQLPDVNVIYDGTHYPGRTIVDYGTNIQSIDISELKALSSSGIIPKLIEQKNNYLFAANVKYEQDEANKVFNKYDMRCFSRGDYIVLNLRKIHFDYNSNLDLFLGADVDDVKNTQLNDNVWRWDRTSWCDNSSEYSGLGKWLKWKYKFNNFSENYYNNNPKSTYFRNEVYRFGIRFFDSKGRPSSVKWIADIKMPDYDIQSEDDVRLGASGLNGYGRGVNIEFLPIGVDENDSPWKLASAYEILLCVRTHNDSFGLTQGIVSFPLCAENSAASGEEDHSLESKKLCVPYLMTLRPTWVERKAKRKNEYFIEKTYERYYSHNRKHLLFASPEECYQQDDVDAILKSNSSSYYIVPIFKFLHYPFDYNDTLVDNKMYTALLGSNPLLPICNGSDEYGLGAYYVDYMGRKIGHHPYGHFAFSARFERLLNSLKKVTFLDSNDTQIKNSVAIKSLDLRKFYNGSAVSAAYSSTSVGDGSVFYNWSGPRMVETFSNETLDDDNAIMRYLYGQWGHDATNDSWEHFEIEMWRTPIGAGGKYLFITPMDNSIFTDLADEHNPFPNITVCQIYKKGVVPYGGRNKGAINDSKYIPVVYSSNTSSSVEAKAGDGYLSDFEFNHLHYVYNDVASNMNTCRVVYQLPIESHIDLKGQSSQYLYSEEDKIQDEADSVKGFVQDTDLYMYNTAYNIIPDPIIYSSDDETDKTTEYTNRVHYSLPKTNNELIDSWTQFKIVSDFLDVDTRYGEITGLKLFKDKLMFMQQRAAGVFASNERTILQDTDNNNIILGNGGVLLRHDYVTTVYGMKPDLKAYATSNEALYWWDGHNKEIIQYQEGFNINQLQHLKLIDSYVQSKNESITPEVFYDKRNKEVVFNVVGDESVVFNEKVGQFTSVYKFCPIFHCDLINGQLLVKDGEIYEYNKTDDGATLFGKEITPLLQYVINSDAMYNKVFDTQLIGGRFYGGSEVQDKNSLPYLVKGEHNNGPLSKLLVRYNTPLKQQSSSDGSIITNYEYEYRLTIPRNGDNTLYGNRMRGNTMQCELKSSSNDLDFSLQYIITKYRISWT